MIRFGKWNDWKYCWVTGNWFGVFRNSQNVVPGRWGFYIGGFEVGSRNPGDRFGTWLKRVGLWPW